jgi:lipoic acid synthetase
MSLPQHLPGWFKQPIPRVGETAEVERLLRDLGLNTVCDGARCPNRGYCYSHNTATFMILGDTCTRNCTFCNVTKGEPKPVQADEPVRVAGAVGQLGLKYVVVTSVTRDDLDDGGASQFARTIRSIHSSLHEVKVEVLVPDFNGSTDSLNTVILAGPDVFAHNIETVPRLYSRIRPLADYHRSLLLLKAAKELNAPVTKSALMLGLGETRTEVLKSFQDLLDAGCDLLTLGQYLGTRQCHPVFRFLTPDEFEEYGRIALEMGFKAVASAPLVRSSFKAAELYRKLVP